MRNCPLFCSVLAIFFSVVQPHRGWARVTPPAYNTYQAQAYQQYAEACFIRFGQQTQCVRLLETALEFGPENPNGHILLGAYYLQTGRTSRAQAEFAQVINLQPLNPLALRAMGDIYVLKGKWSNAAEKYRKLLSILPSEPVGHLGLARIAAARDAPEEALGHLSRAIELGSVDFDLLLKDPLWAKFRDTEQLQELLKQSTSTPPDTE